MAYIIIVASKPILKRCMWNALSVMDRQRQVTPDDGHAKTWTDNPGAAPVSASRSLVCTTDRPSPTTVRPLDQAYILRAYAAAPLMFDVSIALRLYSQYHCNATTTLITLYRQPQSFSMSVRNGRSGVFPSSFYGASHLAVPGLFLNASR